MKSNFDNTVRQILARSYSRFHWKLSLAGFVSLALTAGIVMFADKPVQAKLGSASSSAQPAVATTATPSQLTNPPAAKTAINPTAAAATAALIQNGIHHNLEGIATWYGAVLNGHRTASGERFNMYEFTACHRTLPFGTIVKVTNETNGRSVNVRINDRGILDGDRVIDLSFAAAAKIGIIKAGMAEVKLDIVKWGNGRHHWIHDNPGEKILVQPPPPGYDGPMNIARK